jgi:metal-dependent amidase/aminoacylase/carboxypeptidase family protein
MYTGRVVRLRSFALVLLLQFAATPVIGLVCEMDCDQPPAAPACHESTAPPDGPTVRGARHACDHDHTTSSLALLAAATARDSHGTFSAVSVPAFAYASAPDARVAIAAVHGPPGLSGRTSTSSRITVLRI